MGSHETESFFKAKYTINQTEWEKSFPNTSNRGQHPKYIFKKTQAIRYQENNLMKRGYRAKQRETQIAEKHLKKCSTSLVIREMQIKTTLRFHFTTFYTIQSG